MKKHSCAQIVPIFNHLDADSLDKINQITRHGKFKKNEILYSPLKAPRLFILARGRIKEYQISQSGKEQLLRVYEPGMVLGESALFDTEPIQTYAQALTDIEVCYITKEDLRNLLIDHPTISLKILEEYNRRLKDADKQTTRIATGSVASRLSSYLIDLSKVEDSKTFTLPLSMKELAAFLATSPETISRRFKDLEEDGLITRSNKTITIEDTSGLEDIVL